MPAPASNGVRAGAVGHELQRAEQAAAADIADTVVVAEPLQQQPLQRLTLARDVGDQAVLAQDPLHLECRGAGDRVRLVGVAVHEPAGAVAQRGDDPARHQDAADRRIAAAEALGHRLDIGRHALLLPGVQGAGAAHAAHDLVQDQQRAVPVAHRPHRREIAGQRGDAAGRGPHHGLGQNAMTRAGAEALELRLQLVRQPGDVLRVALVPAWWW